MNKIIHIGIHCIIANLCTTSLSRYLRINEGRQRVHRPNETVSLTTTLTSGMTQNWQKKPIAEAVGLRRTSLTTVRSMVQPMPMLMQIMSRITAPRNTRSSTEGGLITDTYVGGGVGG